MSTETYTISDFTSLSGTLLNHELVSSINEDNSIGVNCSRVDTSADDVYIHFDSSLTSGEKSNLDTLVANYVNPPTPVFRDVNSVVISNSVSQTITNTPQLVTSMTITTSNLGTLGTYSIIFSCSVLFNRGRQVTYQLYKNGSPINGAKSDIHRFRGTDVSSVNIVYIDKDVPNGTIYQVHSSTTGDTLTATYNHKLLNIDGQQQQ